MRILVVGASGFIGRYASAALVAAGHEVIRCARSAATVADVACDYLRDRRPEDWLPRLHGIDAVVNAAGIFRQSAGSFRAVHDEGPRALFSACERAGVRCIVQISALGADSGATTRFHLSKRSADEALRMNRVPWTIVQPSLVFGPGGGSARLLTMLASLPVVVPIPGDGGQMVQPIHIDDLSALIVRVIENPRARNVCIAAVGPRALAIGDWLRMLRGQLGLGPAWFLPIPLALVRRAVGPEAVSMLVRGNTAPQDAARAHLGRALRDPARFVSEGEAAGIALQARLAWLLPVLRAAIALTWIVTGIVSLGTYPVGESLALLARLGLTGTLAVGALYGAAVLDLVLGIAVYALRPARRIWLWRAQLALVTAYSALIAAFLPEFWLHPFGPLLKNIPLMAAILLLHELEPRERWTT